MRPTSSCVNLERCPYDESPIAVKKLPRGSWLVSCEICDAAWELHGSSIKRLRNPDKEIVKAIRRELFTSLLVPSGTDGGVEGREGEPT